MWIYLAIIRTFVSSVSIHTHACTHKCTLTNDPKWMGGKNGIEMKNSRRCGSTMYMHKLKRNAGCHSKVLIKCLFNGLKRDFIKMYVLARPMCTQCTQCTAYSSQCWYTLKPIGVLNFYGIDDSWIIIHFKRINLTIFFSSISMRSVLFITFVLFSCSVNGTTRMDIF